MKKKKSKKIKRQHKKMAKSFQKLKRKQCFLDWKEWKNKLYKLFQRTKCDMIAMNLQE